MSKNEHDTPALVPRLRFPEFRDAEGWEKKRLGAMGYFTGGGTPSKENESYWAGEIPWISSSDLTDESIFQINISRFITKEAVRESATKLVPGNSILLISRVGVGKLAVSTTPVCTSQDFTNFTPTDADLLFLAYSLKSRKEVLLSFNQGTSIKGFTKDNIANVELGLPSPPEQQKIADCLTSLDDLIAAQARKVDALKTLKKGLMQQLFPREGETQPRLRFPEFQDAVEWAAHPFEEFVAKSFYGTSSSTAPTGQYPVLRMGNMVDGGLDFTNLVYIDLDPDSFESFRLKDGDILLNRTNSPALVGKISLFRLKSECITASYIVTYRLNKQRMNPSFCNFMLNTAMYQARIQKLAKPSISQANINPTTFKKELFVSVPALPEQHRIADCLTSLDDLITAQTQKLEALKTHKKGLMQQLFPTPEKDET